MAVFHLTTKPISRKSGRTATAAAAYRAAALIQCEYTGLTHDYRNKRGVDYTECVLVDQDGNPTFLDREQLWNAAELSEKRKDARTAREIIVALPHELDAEGRKFAARAFGGRLSQLYGVAVDVCIHQPDKDGDERNYHAHIMMTTRKVTVENGRAILGEKSDLELSDRELRKRYGSDASGRKFINEIRKRWADGVNSILERKGIDARIDHRSHAARGLQELPTIKMGVAATAMERRGEISERGEINRAIRAANAQYHEIQNEIAQAQQAQADERDRITRNIAITDRAIESTDRAINATDQDAERRKRSIEQRKRSAASAVGATTAAHQRSAGIHHAAAGTDNEVTADDQRAAATRSTADRTIDAAEQHINAAAQHIDGSEQFINETEQHINGAVQDAAAAAQLIQHIQRQIESNNRVEPPPAPPPPAPTISLQITASYLPDGMNPEPWQRPTVAIGSYRNYREFQSGNVRFGQIDVDLGTMQIVRETITDKYPLKFKDEFMEKMQKHAEMFLGRDKDGNATGGVDAYNRHLQQKHGASFQTHSSFHDDLKKAFDYLGKPPPIPQQPQQQQSQERGNGYDFDR